MTTEATYERWFHDRVRLLGGLSFKFAPLVAGNPDRVVLWPGGHIFLVELKAPNGKLSPAQQVWHAKAQRLGVPVYVLANKAQALAWFRRVTDMRAATMSPMTAEALASGMFPEEMG